MKNILKLFIVCLLVSSCDPTESVIFDGRTAVGFAEAMVDLSVPEGGITESVVVTSTTKSSVDRTFEVTVVDASVEESDYSVGTAMIPADSYEGTLDVTFNYEGLEDFVANTLTVELVVAGGGSAFPPITFNFLREFDITTFVCGDLTLSIVVDNFANETTWEILDAAGTEVAAGGPYDQGTSGQDYRTNVSLAAGDYTFTIFDSFGDGLSDGNVEGTYNLFCAAQDVVSYASGFGDFGDDESTDFTIVE